MKKILFILLLFSFANAQIKRDVNLDTFSTTYISGQTEIYNISYTFFEN